MADGGTTVVGNWDGLSPEVMNMIFQHLPVPDLLSCSVVSKIWKKAARDVLKRSKECYAFIKDFHQDIQDLNEMIASTDIMEFINGLHIRNKRLPCWKNSTLWKNCRRCSGITEIVQSEEEGRKLDEARQKILGVLSGQWQYLDLDMGAEWDWQLDVSLEKGLLLREVVLETSNSLQKLLVGNGIDWMFIPCCAKPFLKLKVIHIQEKHGLDCSDNCLINFAPNLGKITGAMMELELQEPRDRFVLERMKSIQVYPNIGVPQGEAREIFGCVSGLHRLDLQQYHYQTDVEDQDLTSLHALIFPFLLRSLDTLEELRMYTLELYNLAMDSDDFKLPNLRRLSLATHSVDVSVANEILALKNLNLPKLCPNLEQLELKESESECNHDFGDDVVSGGEPDGLDQSEVSVAIDLICHRGFPDHEDGLYNHEHMRFLHTIYPKVSKLRILKLRNVVNYDMSKIFWELESLEYLEIEVLRPPYEVEFGIEALLCGINIEEAQLPFLKYQKKKDKLNSCIVPIRPSLQNARNLKELKITEGLLTCQRPLMIRRSWVTKFTENLPERHVRHMKVTFDGSKHFYDRLNLMRAFTWLRANKTKAKILASTVYLSS